MIDNIVFPLALDTFTSSPEFSTTIVPTASGAEQRIGNWLDARVTFNAVFGVRSKKDLQTLVAFFRARKGRLRGFLVRDMLDFEADGDIIAVGTGSIKTYQLQRVYSDAVDDDVYGPTGNTDNRPIYKPIFGTVSIYAGASGTTLLAEGTDYTLDYNTGIITLSSNLPTNNVLNWIGEFYIVCRFVDDKLPADDIFFDWLENRYAGNIPDCSMVEVRDFE